MEPIILTDPAITPNEELIFSIIGDKSVFWKNIMDYLHGNYKDISEVWRFYNDGKCWLFRTLKKKNTVFWLGVTEGNFRVSVSFSDKTEAVFMKSDLPESFKEEFRTAKKFNTTRSITVVMNDSTDVENVIKLIELKMKIL